MRLLSILAGASLAVLGSVAAQAADLSVPTTDQPVYAGATFDWSGLYAGIRGSVSGYTNAPATTSSTFGVVGLGVGVNFVPADAFLIGAEVTGDIYWDNTGTGTTVFANVRAGATFDQALLYAIGGVGIDTFAGNNSVGVYQLGGGVEFGILDSISLRGEVVGLGDFDGQSDAFFEGAQGSVGLFYHF